ncbi:unnamed protein product [Symbiodinium necroappetens]|uniref:Uncharacterized protein n=1 Tax=Symbiodinium necroappetens TaxID=1628268 RepID=A0A813AQ17_9DINO|nr:unnamed protein product [Symbiodinium necroappetens]
MAPAERKRQFAALDRYINANAEGMPPGLVEKYKDSFGSGTKKFEKAWLLDPTMKNVEIESYYVQKHEKSSKGEYEELSLMDWEEIYKTPEQREWLAKIIAGVLLYLGQQGKPHPQDKDNPRARLYKIFRRNKDVDKVQSEVGTKTSAKGAVSEAAAPLVSEILEGAQADFAGAQEAPKGKGKGKGKDKDKEEKKVDPEAQARKELEKDINAISKLAGEARNMGLLLTEWQVPHVDSVQKGLQKHVIILKKIEEEIESMIFNKTKPTRTFATPRGQSMQRSAAGALGCEIVVNLFRLYRSVLTRC